MKNRVLITGIGLVSCLGPGTQITWEGVTTGRRGLRVQSVDEAFPDRRYGGRLPNVDGRSIAKRRGLAKLMGPAARAALFAASEALCSAGVRGNARALRELPVWIASAIDSEAWALHVRHMKELVEESGDTLEITLPWIQEALETMNPVDAIRPNAHALAAHLSMNLDLNGPAYLISPGDSLSAVPLLEAVSSIQHGACSLALVGAAEDPLNIGTFELAGRLGFQIPETLREELGAAALVPSGAACFLVLESARRASRRGQAALAEVVGTAEQTDVSPGAGRTRAIESALEVASLEPGEVDLVHLDALAGRGLAPGHAALGRVGVCAQRSTVTSTRAALGFSMSVAPLLDVGLMALALRDRRAPPLPKPWSECLAQEGLMSAKSASVKYEHALIHNAWLNDAATAVVLRSGRSAVS